MFNKQEVQKKIIALVTDYIRLFPGEYMDFKRGIKMKASLKHDKYATLKGADFIERELGEMPETLWGILKLKLTSDELGYFDTKEGNRWFFGYFRDFRISE